MMITSTYSCAWTFTWYHYALLLHLLVNMGSITESMARTTSSGELEEVDGGRSPQCLGAFDLYFIIDRSTSVSQFNFQNQTVDFVTRVSDHFTSPKLRISIITFSETAHIDLRLTSSRTRINGGIQRLKSIIPHGRTNVHLALRLAKRQIQAIGGQSASVMLILTDGQVGVNRYRAIDEANAMRDKYGTSVYMIGVGNYYREELEQIADEPADQHVFTTENYSSLRNLINSIIKKSCIEILRASPDRVCKQESYSVEVHGRGFTKTQNLSNVICNYHINQSSNHVARPSFVSDTKLRCPGPVLSEIGSTVILQVSVNGKTFVSSNVTVTAVDCAAADVTGLALGILLFLVLLFFPLLWWFWGLCPCVKSKEDVVATAEPEAKVPPKKWPTVDASFYGGGGIGGVKPVKVSWGEKGSTESGSKLTKAGAVREVDSASEVGIDPQPKSSHGMFYPIKMFFIGLLSPVRNMYRRTAGYRPNKGGRNFLYTSQSENYKRTRNSQRSNSDPDACLI